ncbi:MAG: hypothetical protein RLZZ156_435 [Deinococcota bacterium]|jgi:hypothetical protein
MKPPPELDGARVLEWAWSDEMFGIVNFSNGKVAAIIHGLAICQYTNDPRVYRFSCDHQWSVYQDQIYDSVQEAKDHLPEQYRLVQAQWNIIPSKLTAQSS